MRESVKGRWPLAGPYRSSLAREGGEDEMEERRANARARAGARAFLEPVIEWSEGRIQVAHKTLPLFLPSACAAAAAARPSAAPDESLKADKRKRSLHIHQLHSAPLSSVARSACFILGSVKAALHSLGVCAIDVRSPFCMVVKLECSPSPDLAPRSRCHRLIRLFGAQILSDGN